MPHAPSHPGRGPTPWYERAGLWVIVVCGTLAFAVLAWAASLPDGIAGD